MRDLHGKFVWIELMTSDPKAAEGFYTKVVGWSAKDSGQPGMSYTLLSAGETMVGGLMAIPEEAKKMGAGPIWLGYVAVDDVNDYARRSRRRAGAFSRSLLTFPACCASPSSPIPTWRHS